MLIANAHSEERVIEFTDGVRERRVLDTKGVFEGEYGGKETRINRAIYTIRHMSEVAFVILRRSWGLVQCAYEAGSMDFDIRDLEGESIAEMMGVVKTEERAPQGFEIRLEEIRVLSQPAESLPLAISRWKLSTSLGAKLSLRPISLRDARERAKFKIQEGVVRGFRDYPLSRGFTEIHTPKIMARGAEGGSSAFKLEYFNKKAELRQSPQSYKQTMVGVYDKMFEAASAFQAERYSTTRHLNEYASLGFEIGYIDNFRDVTGMEMGILQYVIRFLEQEYKKELDTLGVILSEMGRIPTVRLDQAEELVSRKYDRRIRNPYDLEPEEGLLIGRYFREEYGNDFVFVTHYPSKKRPFYAMDDPGDPKFTLSFDLMFQGLGVATGGQRIHDYREITDKMEKRDMDPEDTVSYLMIFKYGMPPHGGLGIGLEHLIMRLLGGQDVREASMFSRGMARLGPQEQEND